MTATQSARPCAGSAMAVTGRGFPQNRGWPGDRLPVTSIVGDMISTGIPEVWYASVSETCTPDGGSVSCTDSTCSGLGPRLTTTGTSTSVITPASTPELW